MRRLWDVRRLFADGLPAGGRLPKQLLEFCVYDWVGPGQPTTPPDPPQIPADPNGVEGLGAELPVIAPQSCPNNDPNDPGKDQRQTLFEQFRLATRGAAQLPGLAQQVPLVQMALLDTFRNQKFDAGDPYEMMQTNQHSDHGFDMAWTFRNLVCAGSGCLATSRSWLTLPHFDDSSLPDNVNGGSYGMRSDLAVRIRVAVDHWLATLNNAYATSPKRLIIPLALGWANPVPAPAGQTSSDAVREALRYATCHGAIVLSAAGNDTGSDNGVPSSGTLYPAAWESLARPDSTVCKDYAKFSAFPAGYDADFPRFSAQAVPQPPARTAPRLVISVGGVDIADHAIVPTRNASLTRIVAPGAFATSTTDENPATGAPAVFLPPRTGTSVSTIGAAAAVAAIWSVLPNLPPSEVEALLVQSGQLVNLDAGLLDSTACGGSCSLRRVSMCEAVASACTATGACLAPNCAPPSLPDLACVKAQLPSVASPVPTSHTSSDPWTLWPSPAVAPFVHPQPIDPRCDTCGFIPGPGSRLIIKLLAAATPFDSVTLALKVGSQQHLVSVPTTSLLIANGAINTTMVQFNVIAPTSPVNFQTPATATLYWTVNESCSNGTSSCPLATVVEEQIPILY